jgi:hypothetical protein
VRAHGAHVGHQRGALVDQRLRELL